MAKIPAGVGPRLSQIVILFGATGDLAHRKLLPGLFHLAAAGFISKCRIIGVSLDAIDADRFRALARKAVFEQQTHNPKKEAWPAFEAAMDYMPIAAGPSALSDAVGKGREVLRCGGSARPLYERAAERRGVGGQDARRGRPRQGLADHHGEAVRHRSRKRDLAQRGPARGVLRGPDLPHRPFPRQGAGAEHPRLPLRQWPVRTDLERNFIDHVQIDVPETLDIGNRVAFYEQTGAYRDIVVTHLFQILAFMAMEPPTSLAPGPIGEEKHKVFRSLTTIDPANVVRRAIHRLPEGEGRRSRIRHRDLRRAQMLHRQLALGRGAVLPAHRQAHGRRPADHLDRLPSAAEKHVSERFGPRPAGARSPDVRSRRRVQGVAVVLRQAPGAGDATQQAEPAVRNARNRHGPDVLEAYERLILDAMRGDRTLFCSAEGIERLWEVSMPLLEQPPPVKVYAAGSWGAQAIYQLIAPYARRLPFERAWRDPNPAAA